MRTNMEAKEGEAEEPEHTRKRMKEPEQTQKRMEYVADEPKQGQKKRM